MRRTATTTLTLLFFFVFVTNAHAQTAKAPPEPMVPDDPDVPAEGALDAAAPESGDIDIPVRRPRFGDRGQFVISAFSSIGIGSTKYAASDASHFAIGLSPGLDYFFEKNISLGLDLNAEYDQTRGYGADSSLVQTTATTFSAGLRLGVNIPLGEWFSLYPRATLSATTSTTKEEVVNGQSLSIASLGTPSDGTEHAARIFVYAPLLAHLAPGFFVGFGPSLGHDLARKNAQLTYQNLNTGFGAQAIVGGWF